MSATAIPVFLWARPLAGLAARALRGGADRPHPRPRLQRAPDERGPLLPGRRARGLGARRLPARSRRSGVSFCSSRRSALAVATRLAGGRLRRGARRRTRRSSQSRSARPRRSVACCRRSSRWVLAGAAWLVGQARVRVGENARRVRDARRGRGVLDRRPRLVDRVADGRGGAPHRRRAARRARRARVGDPPRARAGRGRARARRGRARLLRSSRSSRSASSRLGSSSTSRSGSCSRWCRRCSSPSPSGSAAGCPVRSPSRRSSRSRSPPPRSSSPSSGSRRRAAAADALSTVPLEYLRREVSEVTFETAVRRHRGRRSSSSRCSRHAASAPVVAGARRRRARRRGR